MKTPRLLFLTCLLIGLSAAAGLAGPGTGPDEPTRAERHGRQLEKLQQALQLTPGQQAQIRTIITERRTAITPLRAQHHENRLELRELVQAETFDAEQARQQLYAAADARVELMAARHTTRQEIAAVLTTEQQAKWQRRQEQRQDRRGQRRHERQCGDPRQ